MSWDSFDISENISSTKQTPETIFDEFISRLNGFGRVSQKNGKTIWSTKEGFRANLNIGVNKKGSGYLLTVKGDTRLQTWIILIGIALILLTYGLGLLILIVFYVYKNKPRKNIEDGLKSVKLKFENDAPSSETPTENIVPDQEQELKKIDDMFKKSLITEEEKVQMRNKVLGLG